MKTEVYKSCGILGFGKTKLPLEEVCDETTVFNEHNGRCSARTDSVPNCAVLKQDACEKNVFTDQNGNLCTWQKNVYTEIPSTMGQGSSQYTWMDTCKAQSS